MREDFIEPVSGDVMALKRVSPSHALKRAIKGYLAERPGTAAALQHLLDKTKPFDGEMPSARGIKTSLLFTDIAGSSAIFEQYGDQYGHQVVAIHDRIVDPIIAVQGGNRIKHTGDGILASFASCGRSVKSAILIQQHVARHNQRFPLLKFQVRIGVNIGVVIQSSGDVYGSSVNLAARLCDAANAGGILTTGIVYMRCEGKGYEFKDRRKTTFKGFRKKIPVFEILGRSAGSSRAAGSRPPRALTN
jgi:class 3 adenylate cyclase